MPYLRASVCEGMSVELPVEEHLQGVAETTDYRDARVPIILMTARLVVDYEELDSSLCYALQAKPAVTDAVRRYVVSCYATDTALVFPVVNRLHGEGAGFAVFPYRGIRSLCR